jgi:hypothetical protein
VIFVLFVLFVFKPIRTFVIFVSSWFKP